MCLYIYIYIRFSFRFIIIEYYSFSKSRDHVRMRTHRYRPEHGRHDGDGERVELRLQPPAFSGRRSEERQPACEHVRPGRGHGQARFAGACVVYFVFWLFLI